jgi:apolipoprotein N-acyltransferase
MRRGRIADLIYLAPGLMAATGQAPLNYWWLALIAWGLALFGMTQARTWRQATWIGWLIGAGYIAGTHFWIVSPFYIDADTYAWMAPFALVGMVAGLALFFAGAYAAAFFIGRGPGARVVALAVCLIAADFLRAWVFTGFPWAQIGSLWLGQPLMQLAALVGVPGVGLLTLLMLAAPLSVTGRARVIAAALSLAVLGAGSYYGLLRLSAPVAETETRIRIVQPNAPQDQKWLPEMAPVFYERLLELTSAPAETPLDIVIWPETALTWRLNIIDELLPVMADAAGGAELIFGVQRVAEGQFFNSLAVLQPDGEVSQIYDKHHLVPFGEYIPMAGLLAATGIMPDAERRGYTPGPGARVLDMGDAGLMLPLICYEAIFARDVAAAPERPDWIVQITNDAWFGTSVMPYQHLDQTRLRAIEQGLPVARGANTGISAMIDPYGRVLASIPLNEAGIIDGTLPAPLAATIYVRTGNWPTIVLLLVLFGGLVMRRGKNDIDVTPRTP